MQSTVAAAKEAFIYGYPIVEIYDIRYRYAADASSPGYIAPINSVDSTRHAATPNDKAIVAMNCDPANARN